MFFGRAREIVDWTTHPRPIAGVRRRWTCQRHVSPDRERPRPRSTCAGAYRRVMRWAHRPACAEYPARGSPHRVPSPWRRRPGSLPEPGRIRPDERSRPGVESPPPGRVPGPWKRMPEARTRRRHLRKERSRRLPIGGGLLQFWAFGSAIVCSMRLSYYSPTPVL